MLSRANMFCSVVGMSTSEGQIHWEKKGAVVIRLCIGRNIFIVIYKVS